MTNVQFDYQYRDASGSKMCNHVIFANPDNLDLEDMRLGLQGAFWEAEFFVAGQVRIPEVFLYLEGSVDDDLDHCLHHFDSLELTSCPPTDSYERSIREFIREVEHQSSQGWRMSDPRKDFGTCKPGS